MLIYIQAEKKILLLGGNYMKKILSYTLFWLLQCTWGFIMTFIGACAALGLIITGHKPKHLGPMVYFEVGENWGGVELGGFFLCDKSSGLDTKYHECGHGLQNLIWGPLMPFLICIPSATRYWLRECETHTKKLKFSLFIFICSLTIFTSLAIFLVTFCAPKIFVIIAEVLRLYFVLICVWLNAIEIPRYRDPKVYVDYDAIWFEGQATRWGTKVYEKKEG